MKKTEISSTIIIIVGILLFYVLQMAPSPVLLMIQSEYGLVGKDSLLNLCVSMMYPSIIVFSLIGEKIERKIGTARLFSVAIVFVILGCVIGSIEAEYIVFLLSRLLYGIGFGLGIPFIGSAISFWYEGRARDNMDLANGLFPFAGGMISFMLIKPLSTLFKSWKYAIGIWAVPLCVILLLWVTISQKKLNCAFKMQMDAVAINESTHTYQYLFSLKQIRSLTYCFMGDFFCYSYIVAILPLWIYEQSLGNITEQTANIIAALAFPASGMLGSLVGGIVSAKRGTRRPVIISGQILKTIGVFIACLFTKFGIIPAIIGFVIYGFGNGYWIPAMYSVPTDMKEIPSNMVGSAFAFISVCGFIMGFISPLVGGVITDTISSYATHFEGLRISLLVFNMSNIISWINSIRLSETGASIKK